MIVSLTIACIIAFVAFMLCIVIVEIHYGDDDNDLTNIE